MSTFIPSINDELYGQRSDLVGLRASTMARCPRRAAYEFNGTTPDERPFSKGALERGIYLGKAMAQYDADQQASIGYTVELEREVAWPSWTPAPMATGHIDVFRIEGGEVREISTRRDGGLDPAKAVQAVIYAVNDPVAEQATVVVLDPSDWRRAHEYGLDVEALTPTILALEHALIEALEAHELPDRVCAHPEDEKGIYCPFKGPCFEGWQAPPVRDAFFEFAPELAAMTFALDARAQAKEAVKEAEARVKELASKLNALEPGVWYETPNGYELRRRKVTGRRTVDLAALEASGHLVPDDFINVGEPYTVWDRPRLAETPFPAGGEPDAR